MSNSAWNDLNTKGGILKIHDFCSNSKCKCQKQTTFTARQFQIEGGSIKNKLKSIFRGTQAAWNTFTKPAVFATAPFIGMAVSAKTEISKVGQATANILKNISGGENLSLKDLHGIRLRLKVI